MCVTWSEARKRGVHALSEIEVDEVSLVDRPATGKRFVLFKRRLPFVGARENNANIRSEEVEEEAAPAPVSPAMEALSKRAEETRSEVARLQDMTADLAARLTALEAGRAGRQSVEPASPARNLWAGVL